MKSSLFHTLTPFLLLAALLTTGCGNKESARDRSETELDNESTATQPGPSPVDRPTAPPHQTRQLSYALTQTVNHPGCCDGSAGVALDEQHFLVANDENSILRVYSREGNRKPVAQINLRKFLDLKKKDDESDLEGMTKIGSTVYTIASHSRSKDGDKRKGRRQLFGLSFQRDPNKVRLSPLGEPYTKLLKDLEDEDLLEGFDFERAARQAGGEKDGLNIEGLTSTPEGGLLIGFRTPIHKGKTLLIEIENPNEVIHGSKPRFGPARQILLGEMGIRGIERTGESYLLTTESVQGKRYPQLFEWNGSEPRPRRVFASLPKSLNPESVLIFPQTGIEEIHLLSDDGNEKISSKLCHDIKDDEEKRFRRLVLRRRTSR